LASSTAWARLAAYHMTFFGTQPLLTQVPPSLCGLDDGDALAVLGGLLGNREAAAAAADGDEIEMRVHVSFPKTGCSIACRLDAACAQPPCRPSDAVAGDRSGAGAWRSSGRLQVVGAADVLTVDEHLRHHRAGDGAQRQASL
jgi:hypothetical protein